MRILFTSQPEYSHLIPIVLPMALLADKAGHDVVVATGAEMMPHLRSHHVNTLELPGVASIGSLVRNPERARAIGFQLPVGDFGAATRIMPPEMYAIDFVSVLGSRFGRSLITVLDDWQPDVIVRESTEFGGYLAAEYMGIPHAVIDLNPTAPIGHPAFLAQINTEREMLGLPGVSEPSQVQGELRASFLPEAFYSSEEVSAGRYYQLPSVEQGEAFDPEILKWVDGRSVVLVSAGMAAHLVGEVGPFGTIISVLGDLPIAAVVVLDGDVAQKVRVAGLPKNVMMVPRISQRAFLGHCSLLVSHGGFNSVVEALTAGVPGMAIPMTNEQAELADRISDLGVSTYLRLEDFSAEALWAMLSRAVADEAMIGRANAVKQHIRGLPRPEQMMDDILRFAS